jgi:hypothetical protein
MNKKYAVIVALAAFCIVDKATAGTPGMTVAFPIETIFSRDIGFDVMAQTSTNPMACAITGAFRVQTSTPNRESMVATLLTAFSSGKKISLWVSGCELDGVSTVLGVRIER